MRKLGLTLTLITLWAAGPTHAGPLEDVQRLVAKASAAPVTFSDGTSQWIGNPFVYRTSNGKAIIVKAADLKLDTDGASKEIRACDNTSAAGTALPGPKGKPTDANITPYFVLPGCADAANKAACKAPYKQLGMQLGDLATVISGDKIAFAIAADSGPEKKFGEGSIQLHRQLGHEVVGKVAGRPKCAANRSLASETYLVVFPGSNKTWLPNDRIQQEAGALWNGLLSEEAEAK
ncbi:glycoside hydrolase family 75 protein [Cupriavidus basilensis]|uniref:Glycoside hydrolase family 75 protein n=1 Tax=Cupriavidus basilensis TaxID=68895 RepID=A0ABT6ASR3_9BURK|nr:glycoside hydrolase family 75 protein [Cupriavidus basilensis]MDF3835652.1 glycoside hydrolase family 75 protein [Cupriavidus basilensis]